MSVTEVPRFRMRQRITLMVNRYEFFETSDGASEGRQFGFAEQKRLALREQVTIYADSSRASVVCSFKARSVLDFGPDTTSWTAPASRSAGSRRISASRCCARPGTSAAATD